MLLNANRSACVVAVMVALASAAGCGQDLDLGPLGAGPDGLHLPPPGSSPGSSAAFCATDSAAMIPLPDRCFADVNTGRVTSDEGTFEYKVISESCLVTADGQVISGAQQVGQLPACPIGLYWKFAPGPWRRPGPPLLPEGAFPSRDVFEQAIHIYRGTDPAALLPGFERPFISEGWNTVPRSVEVLPEQQAVFIRFDPRPSNGQRFVVFVSLAELLPAAVRLRADPAAYFWVLDIGAGAPPVIDSEVPAPTVWR